MKAMVFISVAATVFGATSALAQAPKEVAPDPTITQNEGAAPGADSSMISARLACR